MGDHCDDDDDDNDAIPDAIDNCPMVHNPVRGNANPDDNCRVMKKCRALI